MDRAALAGQRYRRGLNRFFEDVVHLRSRPTYTFNNYFRDGPLKCRVLGNFDEATAVTKDASSAEFVGEFWFGELAKSVIQSDFRGSKLAEAIRLSEGEFDLVV